MKSATALPSRRNSGFDTTLNGYGSRSSLLTIPGIQSPAPIGIVVLLALSGLPVIEPAIARADHRDPSQSVLQGAGRPGPHYRNGFPPAATASAARGRRLSSGRLTFSRHRKNNPTNTTGTSSVRCTTIV